MDLFRKTKDQPRLDIEPSSLERALVVLAWLAVALNVAVIVYYWPLLPQEVPQHFDARGNVDAWGSRMLLLGLPAMSLVLVGGVTWLTRYPHLYNFLWPITEENARRQYELANELMAAIQAVTALLFAMICLEICRLAIGRTTALGTLFVPLTVGALFGAIGVYLVRAHRAR